MAQPKKLAVVGAGLVGQRHIAAISQADGVDLAAVVEPGATEQPVPVFKSLSEMFDAVAVDGVILSTPTLLHVEGAMECVQRSVPVLIEKPLAASADDAQELIDFALPQGRANFGGASQAAQSDHPKDRTTHSRTGPSGRSARLR